MGYNQGLRKVGNTNLKVFIALGCIFLLVSCEYTTPDLQESPDTTLSLSATTNTPQIGFKTPQYLTPDPTSLYTLSGTLPPQVTPVEGNSIPSEITKPPTRYHLNGELDYYQHTLSITETISYQNNTTDSLTDLILVVEPNRRASAFKLESLTWKEGGSIEGYDFSHDQLYIPLIQPLAPGDGFGMVIRYTLNIPEISPPSDTNRPLPFGYTERQTNLVDWYPYIPPYRSGEGWLVHQNWWFGEHQVFDMAEFQVELTLAEPVQGLIIAASAPAERDGNSYVYHLEFARSFALSASDKYLVQTTSVEDVTIYSYSFPFHEDAGREALHNTADAVRLFSELIMPYPHSTLSAVEADFLDGMEYDGLYFLSNGFYNLYDGTPQGYLTFIAAHETAHQWWYGLVGNDQALEPWLDEAMCTYMEHIFYENIYADYLPKTNQSLVDWWWYYRVNFYDPTGWIDGTIYDFNQFRTYRDTIYLNGAQFLDELRNLIGDQAFFAFLRDYAERNKHQVATASDFFNILQENTSKDLNGLMVKYFQSVK